MNDPVFDPILRVIGGSMDVPCRVSCDLRRYQSEQDSAQYLADEEREARREEAREAIVDGAKLAEVMNDEALAYPLAKIMGLLPSAIDESTAALLAGQMVNVAEIIRELRKVQTLLVKFHMGEG